MSTTIDQRIVEMRFDNSQFERNVGTSMSTLAKLKQSLNLTGASKGLENVGAAAKGMNFSPVSSAVETLSLKFSALQVAGITALSNITNSAVNAGKRIASALTIDPIKTGFQEYETQINAVQTILANTESKGTTIDDVNKALDTLNTYADKTIYNFTEMTRNIGTFTAAGVDLDTSVKSIQGIANLAAVSGSSSQQASTAMYQLSQALAAGKVSLMDWNSVVNAGMGGQVFQDALKRTSEVMGTGAEAAIKKYGSFRESLTKGEWLTTDVLTATLEQFTMAAEEGSKEWEEFKKSLMDDGYTEKQAEDILKMANTASDAATKVKTFTQLWDTLKEAVQSGWTQSWEIIIGDFEEAKEMLSSVSDVLNEMIGKSAEARNKLLQGWKDLGGRNVLVEGITKAFHGLMNIVTPIKDAFRDIFPPTTASQLFSITTKFKDLMTVFSEFTSSHAGEIKSVFKGIFSAASLLAKGFGVVAKAVLELLGSDGFKSLVRLLADITIGIADFFTEVNAGFSSGGLSGGLSNLVKVISDILETAVNGIRNFGDVLVPIGDTIAKVAGKIWEGLKTVFGWITENISAGDIFAGLAGGGIFKLLTAIANPIEKVQDILQGFFGGDGGPSIKDRIGDILMSVRGSIQAFTSGIRIASLVSIAAAIGILSIALTSISKLKVPDIAKSLFAIGIMFSMLSLTFKSVSKTLDKFNVKGVVKAGFSLILIATAMNILASAMKKISDLSLTEIGKGLVGVGGGLAILCGGLKLIGKTKISLSTSVAMLALAQSCKMLGDAMQKFSGMSWEEIGKGLIGMGGALGELVVAMGVLKKFGGGGSLLGSLGILITVQSLSDLADGLKKFGEMNWDEIGRGLSSMGGALGEVGLVLGSLGKFAGFSSIFASGAILIVVQGLDDLAESLKKFGEMAWEEIKLGLAGMGGTLGELGIIIGGLGKFAGFSSIFASGAILIVIQGLRDLADGLKKFGEMTWEEIGHGLTGMGGALLEVAGIAGTLGRLTGLSGLLGGGALLLAIQGLGDLADAFKKFGEMTWEEIGRGLVGMGGALLEVAGITGALGTLAGLPALLGSGSILLAVQGLSDLADALKKFGEMSWEEIGHGLTAMGAALGELAIGGLLNTLSIIGSYSISEMAEPLGVLADSVKKWEGVTVPEGLGWQLMMLADGVSSFTFGGLGASAIAEVATPLGAMADSVKKWVGVTVPEGIGTQLAALADGVGEFTFGGLGASAIADLGTPLGNLADSVKKWQGVTVPDTMGEQLTQLADGIKAFSWAFMGGWSINTIVEPLGALPESIKKWNGVKVPDGLEEDLKALASAVQSFTWAFVGGWSIDSIKGPLGDLAGAVKKWNGVTIPSDMGTKLKDLAGGLKSFTGVGEISHATSGMKSIASSAGKLAGINYDSIAPGLKSIASGLKTLSNVDTSKFEGFKNISLSIDKVVKSIKNAGSKFKTAGTDLMNGLAKGIKSGQSKVTNANIAILKTALNTIKSKVGQFSSAGSNLMKALVKGISSCKNMVNNAVRSAISSAVSSINTCYASFYNAGVYLGEGLVLGLNAMQSAAYAAGYALGQAAVQGEKDGQASNSPSKLTMKAGRWLGEGLIIGMEKMYGSVNKAGEELGSGATKNISTAISRIRDSINSDLDTQPTIKPILDLSEVQSGASVLSGLFNNNPSVGVMANISSISAMRNNRQNGINDDIVSAINDLKGSIGQSSGNIYSIGGITYDDGSNVSTAIEELMRAARIERRV